MNEFNLLKGANNSVLQELTGWNLKIVEYVNEDYNGDFNLVKGTQFGDGIAKIIALTELAFAQHPCRGIAQLDLFRGAADAGGLLQAGAIIEEDVDGVAIDILVSAPWNILGNKPETIRGAGTALIEMLILESVELGFGGKLKLYPVRRALGFYESIGFAASADGSGEIELTPDSAQRFLKRQAERRSIQ